MTYVGPIAGGPWHGSVMEADKEIVRCPILPAGMILEKPLSSVVKIGNIQAADYRWHVKVKMWIWNGPNVPIRQEPSTERKKT